MMADAIVRTLLRRFVTKRKLLEWETMWQSESGRERRLGPTERYLYLSSGCALVLLLIVLRPVHVVVALICSLWIVAPLVVGWLNERPSKPARLDLTAIGVFCAESALRTWRFFADHSTAENHWLVPDNVQEGPPSGCRPHLAHESGIAPDLPPGGARLRISQLQELSAALGRTFDADGKYAALSRAFLQLVRYPDASAVAAALRVFGGQRQSGGVAVRGEARLPGAAGATDAWRGGPGGAARPCAAAARMIPHPARKRFAHAGIANLLRHLDCRADGSCSYWESVLTESRDMVQRVREALWRIARGERRLDEAHYWEDLLWERVEAALG